MSLTTCSAERKFCSTFYSSNLKPDSFTFDFESSPRTMSPARTLMESPSGSRRHSQMKRRQSAPPFRSFGLSADRPSRFCKRQRCFQWIPSLKYKLSKNFVRILLKLQQKQLTGAVLDSRWEAYAALRVCNYSHVDESQKFGNRLN